MIRIGTNKRELGGVFIFAPNHPQIWNMVRIQELMRDMGDPAIQAVWSPEHECWFAIDGSNRLAVLRCLGKKLVIEELPFNGPWLATLKSWGEDGALWWFKDFELRRLP